MPGFKCLEKNISGSSLDGGWGVRVETITLLVPAGLSRPCQSPVSRKQSTTVLTVLEETGPSGHDTWAVLWWAYSNRSRACRCEILLVVSFWPDCRV